MSSDSQNSPSSILTILSSYIESGDTRQTTINWKESLKAIIDGYESAEGLVHGVQKDAIQNGWDARKNKKGRGWKLTFELIENKDVCYLSMTDEGTTGLTGRILKPYELEKDLPGEERWGRFENMAFRKEPSDDKIILGSRGRGKFIFVGASKDNAIFYDTLREDRVYRLGGRVLTTTKTPVNSWDNEDGKKRLFELTKGIFKPLEKVGTRVIIINPVEELINSIRTGKFLRYISVTWWEIIQKYDAQICVKYDGKEYYAKIPEEFILPEKDSNEYKVWIKERQIIKRGQSEFKIKKLHIVCTSITTTPSDIQGILIQRGGMKICSVYPKFLPQEMTESIYGYLTLDEESEKVLLKYEDPEHYSFSKRAFPNAIMNYVESELNELARQKLGHGRDERAIKRERSRNAERKAIAAINELASKYGFQGGGIGRKPPKPPRPPGEVKLIRLQMPELTFPRVNDLRVNYGETIKNITCAVINDTDCEIYVKVKIFLRHYEEDKPPYTDEDIIVKPHSKSNPFGPFEQTFSEDTHPEHGEYTAVCRLINMMKEKKGDKLDEKKKKFYLEEDPPKYGLFESCDALQFPENIKNHLGEAIPGAQGGYILQYNILHPEYDLHQNDEDELTSYLYRLLSFELCRIDIEEDAGKLFKKEELDFPASTLSRTLELLGEFSSIYYSR